jgi:hypothetical protein
MRSSILIGLCTVATIGCGNDSQPAGPDAPTGNHPPPRVIAGGGIGDGPVDGVVNLYVIDDASRMPVDGASVDVGSVSGTTDATGLFVADGVMGAQTMAVAAAGYRSELWLGANGANVTIDVKAAIDPSPTQAHVSGSITGFESIVVPAGHHKMAIVTYSQDDKATDAENNLTTPSYGNYCDTATGSAACTFTVITRTGHVALIAAIVDHDLNGTPTNPADDKYTIIGWAQTTGLVVQDGVDQSGIALSMVPVGSLTSTTVDFGSPPGSLPNVAAVIGIETATDGTLELAPAFLTPAAPTLALTPKLDAFPGATYRLTGIANNNNGTNSATAATSIVLQRGLTGGPFAAGTWLAPPAGLSLTRTAGSWSAVSGALVTGATYDIDSTQHLLSVTALDGSTSFTLPSVLALPATGDLIASGTALAGTLDLTSFSIDSDLAKVTGLSSQPMTIH